MNPPHPNKPLPSSLRWWKALLPLVISIWASYILFNDFSGTPYKFTYTKHTLFCIFLAVVMMLARDVFYILRLRLLTDNAINWSKSIQIIALWEFASAITPGAIGGSVAAVFMLTREGIRLGKSTSLILITAFLDELIFIIVLPVVYIIMGNSVFHFNTECAPIHLQSFMVMWAKPTIIITYLFLVFFYAILFYGLFINAKSLKRAFHVIGNIRILSKWKYNIISSGKDIERAAIEAKSKSRLFWIKAISYTFISWSSRYLLAYFIIVALSTEWYNVVAIYSKLYFVRVLSIIPITPGGSGVSEASFVALLCMYIPNAFIQIATLSWRILSYHIYLLVGILVLPIYLRKKNNT